MVKCISSGQIDLLMAAIAWNLRRWVIAFFGLFIPGVIIRDFDMENRSFCFGVVIVSFNAWCCSAQKI